MSLPAWLHHKKHIPYDAMVCPSCNSLGRIYYLYGYGHVCSVCDYGVMDGRDSLDDVLTASKLHLLSPGRTLAEAKEILVAAGKANHKLKLERSP